MPRKTNRLGIWLGDTKVAELEQRRAPEIRCVYTEEALNAWPLNTPVVSCSLPLGSNAQNALPFCKGLLPEGQALATMAAQAGLAANDSFGLLARYGRDVAGALVVGEEEPEPRRYGVDPYDDESLAQAIGELDDYPLGAHDDSELSLAGLQDKLLLADLGDGRWGRPLHGRPSTHILKVEDRRFPNLNAAEAMCLELAKAAGLTSIESRLETIGEIPCLIVSRYDRRVADGGVERIHQEDLCQATGIDPAPGPGGRSAKYERYGGPGLRNAAQLLDVWSANPDQELDQLVAIVTFTVLIGNADAHAKNLSFLHPAPGEISLAPIYDTVPTALWPSLRTEAAMSVGAQVDLPAVTLDDIGREAEAWKHPAERAREIAQSTIAKVLAATDAGAVHADSDLAALVRARAAQLDG